MSNANDKGINYIWGAVLAVVAVIILATMGGCQVKGAEASGIPAAAATEGNLVCQPFGGLEYFDVEVISNTNPEGVQVYLVRSYCHSGHVVAGRINLQKAKPETKQ